MNNATQGIFTPKNYEIYHPNKNALSKNLSAKSEDKPKQMKYLNEWHKQCYEGIHTKSDEISFSKDELVPIFARFCLHKAKLYNHNSKSKQQKTLNYLLLQENHLCLSSFKIIRKWINHCAKNGLVSIKILGNILQMLESLLKLHNDRFAPNMSEEKFLAYFHSLSKKLKNSTINKYIIYLDMFLRYVGENLNIKVRCLKTIRKKFAKERALPSFLNQSQFNDFLDFVKNMKANNLTKKRDRLIMLMVSYTGMRTKEVWNLKYSDIAKDNFSGTYVFRIQGKGLKTRLASVKIELIDDFLQDFIKSKDKLGIKTPYLFNLKNNAIPIQKSISLKPILEKLNAVQERGNYLHLLRHSFASFVYAKSKDLLLTQEMLGHNSINTTQIYVHLNQESHNKVAQMFA
ncbi:tyrosine-type recombinase/integrase [Helicobacter sp. T3_23-1056]